jgi:hypothetical protein
MPKKPKPADNPEVLRGWVPIAAFLGQPVSVAQRWAKSGMPVSHAGRNIVADPAKLNAWLGRTAGEPVQIVGAKTDLKSELQRGLSYVKKRRSI